VQHRRFARGVTSTAWVSETVARTATAQAMASTAIATTMPIAMAGPGRPA